MESIENTQTKIDRARWLVRGQNPSDRSMYGHLDLSTHLLCLAPENIGFVGQGGGQEPMKGSRGILWRWREIEGM